MTARESQSIYKDPRIEAMLLDCFCNKHSSRFDEQVQSSTMASLRLGTTPL